MWQKNDDSKKQKKNGNTSNEDMHSETPRRPTGAKMSQLANNITNLHGDFPCWRHNTRLRGWVGDIEVLQEHQGKDGGFASAALGLNLDGVVKEDIYSREQKSGGKGATRIQLR